LQKKPYSERSAYSFKKVERQGITELVEAVRAGHLAVSLASKIAELPTEEQARLLTLSKVELRAELGKKPRQKAALSSIEDVKACVRRIVEMIDWRQYVPAILNGSSPRIPDKWFNSAAEALQREGFTVTKRR